ncbi:hypothetical protein fugu_018596 [Takifugu bimaculatus]|uniref:Uncharacterized protein n=1 Tax=Takifugu bimaculatus TaxID=433685 RepID=A0A4Z2BLP7_9TELE|nr:hypothetical protein fugu_018596 [Takifugu bimaculatus]
MGSRAFHGVFPWVKNKAPLTGTRDPASAAVDRRFVGGGSQPSAADNQPRLDPRICRPSEDLHGGTEGS